MAASAWTIYNAAKEWLGDGTFDMDADAFKLALFASGYTPSATHDNFSTISGDEISHSSYNAGGEVLNAVTWNRSAGVVTFDSDNVSWDATTGTLSAKYGVMYNDTLSTGTGDPVTDGLLCYSNLSSTGGTVSVTSGNTLTVQMSASGIFTVS